jgi:PAS domain S-box-containing protein
MSEENSTLSAAESEAQLGFFSVNAKGDVRSWDARMVDMLGYQPEEIVGRSMEILIPEVYRERHWRGFLRAMSRGTTKHDQPKLNTPLLHQSGELLLHPAREILLRDAFGSAVGVLAIISPACLLEGDNGLISPYNDAFDQVAI